MGFLLDLGSKCLPYGRWVLYVLHQDAAAVELPMNTLKDICFRCPHPVYQMRNLLIHSETLVFIDAFFAEPMGYFVLGLLGSF